MENKVWTQEDKLQWVLENGEPVYPVVFERVGNKLYKRPCAGSPPWVPMERVLVSEDIFKEGLE
jgi:hypothetical protein